MTTTTLLRPLRFEPSFEVPEEGEAETRAKLRETFLEMAGTVAEKQGHAFRAVHAKGHGLISGRLQVHSGLPEELAQGLFAQAAGFDTWLRLSSPPSELLSDAVTLPRALAMKVLGVPGETLVKDGGHSSQDFLMVDGPVFPRRGPKSFLKDNRLLSITTERAPRAKEILSTALRGIESALEAVGGESGMLKGMGGAKPLHPLGRTYFTQVPFLHGPYMAKYSLAPLSPGLLALREVVLDTGHEDAQRDAVNRFFQACGADGAVWELRVQLCTDIDKMPIEDASVEWPEQLSPYVAVATFTAGTQVPWSTDLVPIEDVLTFDPWHALPDHRPLGALNRVRREVYEASRTHRAEFNGCPAHAPSLP